MPKKHLQIIIMYVQYKLKHQEHVDQKYFDVLNKYDLLSQTIKGK